MSAEKYKTKSLYEDVDNVLDYHHKLAMLCQLADETGKRNLRREMKRVQEKFAFLNSFNAKNES